MARPGARGWPRASLCFFWGPGGGLRGRVEPGAARGVQRRRDAFREFAADFAEGSEALGYHVVLVDRLEVDLAGLDERGIVEVREGVDHAADHLADAVLDEAGPAVGLLDHV